MHYAFLLWLAVGAGAGALVTAIPTPLAPYVGGLKVHVRRWLNAPALGFLVATAVVGAIGEVLRAWIESKAGVEVPLGTVRWALMSAELGLWLPLLAWITAAIAGLLTAVRGWVVAQGWHPSLVLGLVAGSVWYAW